MNIKCNKQLKDSSNIGKIVKRGVIVKENETIKKGEITAGG